MSEWEEAFKLADKDNSGTIDYNELKAMLKEGNCNLPESQIDDIFEYFDGPKGDRRITLKEFVKGLENIVKYIEKLQRLFDKYDADKSGYLDKNELRKILELTGHKFTDSEIEKVLKMADTSGDGKVSFDEFLDACT
ncbi:calmodulin [Plakobranchus ocellatus]|uniref:Calmodulin n=1 Tax=Plakobranchus ocellatus TaxID=259542 RepID=A0AAV3XZ63_9GAST|nr:calmodulin [Plakobranchus ocellatus]